MANVFAVRGPNLRPPRPVAQQIGSHLKYITVNAAHFRVGIIQQATKHFLRQILGFRIIPNPAHKE